VAIDGHRGDPLTCDLSASRLSGRARLPGGAAGVARSPGRAAFEPGDLLLVTEGAGARSRTGVYAAWPGCRRLLREARPDIDVVIAGHVLLAALSAQLHRLLVTQGVDDARVRAVLADLVDRWLG
jgi:hydrogenase maturation factor HypE